jgi:hypothetical protein
MAIVPENAAIGNVLFTISDQTCKLFKSPILQHVAGHNCLNS